MEAQRFNIKTLDFGRKEKEEKRDKERQERQKKAREDFFAKKRQFILEYFNDFDILNDWIDKVAQCIKTFGEPQKLYLAFGLFSEFNTDKPSARYKLSLYYCIKLNGLIKFIYQAETEEQTVLSIEQVKKFIVSEYLYTQNTNFKYLLPSKYADKVARLLSKSTDDLESFLDFIKFEKITILPLNVKCVDTFIDEDKTITVPQIQFIPTEELFTQWVKKVVSCALENSQENKFYLAFGVIEKGFLFLVYSIKIQGKIYFGNPKSGRGRRYSSPALIISEFKRRTSTVYWIPSFEVKNILMNPNLKEPLKGVSYDPLETVPQELSCFESLEENPNEDLVLQKQITLPVKYQNID